jgi:hypothetical protein
MHVTECIRLQGSHGESEIGGTKCDINKRLPLSALKEANAAVSCQLLLAAPLGASYWPAACIAAGATHIARPPIGAAPAPAGEAHKMAELVRICCQADSRLSPLSLSGLSLLPALILKALEYHAIYRFENA